MQKCLLVLLLLIMTGCGERSSPHPVSPAASTFPSEPALETTSLSPAPLVEGSEETTDTIETEGELSMNPEKFIAQLRRKNFTAEADALQTAGLPCITLTPKRVRGVSALLNKTKDEAEFWEKCRALEPQSPLGNTKFGGAAHVPPDFVTPTADGKDLVFLAQINCAEVFGLDNRLPPEGLLSFWYDGQGWGLDDESPDIARVFYFPTTADLVLHTANRANFKEDVSPFLPATVKIASTLSLPLEDMMVLNDEIVEDHDEDRFEVWETLYDQLWEWLEETQNSQMLGHPIWVQGEEFPDPPEGWVLLFQLDSYEEELCMMWGDMGKLYFLIRASDLAARNFDNIKFVLQCY